MEGPILCAWRQSGVGGESLGDFQFMDVETETPGEMSCLWGHIVCRLPAQSSVPGQAGRVVGAESKDGFSAQGPGRKGNFFFNLNS